MRPASRVRASATSVSRELGAERRVEDPRGLGPDGAPSAAASSSLSVAWAVSVRSGTAVSRNAGRSSARQLRRERRVDPLDPVVERAGLLGGDGDGLVGVKSYWSGTAARAACAPRSVRTALSNSSARGATMSSRREVADLRSWTGSGGSRSTPRIAVIAHDEDRGRDHRDAWRRCG